MFTVEPLPSYERDARCRLLINGKPLDTYVTISGGLLHINVEDNDAIDQFVRYTLLELPPLETLWLHYDSECVGLINLVWITADDERSPKPTSFDITFGAEPDLAKWNRAYSFAEYCESLDRAIQRINNPDIEFTASDEDRKYVTEFTIRFPFATPALPIGAEINRRSALIRTLHELVENSLVPPVNSHSVAVTFDFPQDVKVPCEQYLLYFVEFLRDLGVDATSELKHQAGKALFTVTPTDSQEALGKIRTALEIYLTLPSSPIGNIPADSGTEVQKLAANVHYLRSQLALSQAVIEAKNATIQAHQLTIETQRVPPGDLVRNSVIDITPAASESEKEDLLGGAVTITKYQGKGFEINLPEIYRWLRKRFAEKW